VDILFALALIFPSNQIGESGSWGLVEFSSGGEYDLDGDCLKFDESGDPNTYLCPSAADEVTLTCGGVDVWVCNASGCDLAGELGAVTSLDATTLATVVAAISSNGSEYDDDVAVCFGDDDDFCVEHDTDGSPDGLRLTQADCDGSACNPLEFYKSGGDNAIAMRASSFTNPDGKMTFGAAAASGHSLGANDSHFTGNKFEVDGVAYFNDDVNMSKNIIMGSLRYIIGPYGSGLLVSNTYQTNEGVSILTVNGNYVLISEYADRSINFNHAVQTDPPIFGHSADETDITQFFSLKWNRLALGGDGGGLGCINQTFAYDDFTDGGGLVGTLVLDEGIPDGAVVQRSLLHSLTGFTGGANTTATAQIGDGTDADRYTTGTPSIYTTNASGVDLGVPSGTAWHDDAKSVTVTATVDNDWSTIAAGEATVAVCYWTP
jgi:hypothetical protein